MGYSFYDPPIVVAKKGDIVKYRFVGLYSTTICDGISLSILLLQTAFRDSKLVRRTVQSVARRLRQWTGG